MASGVVLFVAKWKVVVLPGYLVAWYCNQEVLTNQVFIQRKEELTSSCPKPVV